jgi:hypothetical protein
LSLQKRQFRILTERKIVVHGGNIYFHAINYRFLMRIIGENMDGLNPQGILRVYADMDVVIPGKPKEVTSGNRIAFFPGTDCSPAFNNQY